MNSSEAIMIACVFMVAAFAGVLIAADGDEADGVGNTVTYKLNGYTYAVPVEGTSITLPSLADLGATVEDGKTFVGWNLVKDGVTDTSTIYAVGSTYALTGDTTFEACVTTDKYTIIFAYADGTSILEKKDQTYNTELTLPAKNATKAAGKVLAFDESTGQVFAGWAYVLDPTTVIIDPSVTKVKVTEDAAYVAVYVHDPVLTFIVDGTTTYKHTEYGITIPTDPSKDGFKFVGWNDGKNTVASADLGAYIAALKGDAVLTAVWEPAVYTVTFIVDGETVMVQSVKHGETATEPKFTPAKDGCDFVCWSISPDQSAYSFDSAVTGDLTVAAIFKETPAPAPTGLKDPTMQMMIVIIATLVIALIALGVWKRDAIRVTLVKKLDKGKGNGGDGAA